MATILWLLWDSAFGQEPWDNAGRGAVMSRLPAYGSYGYESAPLVSWWSLKITGRCSSPKNHVSDRHWPLHVFLQGHCLRRSHSALESSSPPMRKSVIWNSKRSLENLQPDISNMCCMFSQRIPLQRWHATPFSIDTTHHQATMAKAANRHQNLPKLPLEDIERHPNAFQTSNRSVRVCFFGNLSCLEFALTQLGAGSVDSPVDYGCACG